MADYRLDCCGGYPNHMSGCHVLDLEREYERKAWENKRKADDLWERFFDGMTDEQLFTYLDLCDKEVTRAYKFRKRADRARYYMREHSKTRKFMEWKKNGQVEHRCMEEE